MPWKLESNTRIHNTEHASSMAWTVSLPQLAIRSTRCFSLEQEILWHSRYMIWLIFMLKGRQHRITINYHSCFHSRWPNSKTKLKWNHLWEQGTHSLRILRIGMIGSDSITTTPNTYCITLTSTKNTLPTTYCSDFWLIYQSVFPCRLCKTNANKP